MSAPGTTIHPASSSEARALRARSRIVIRQLAVLIRNSYLHEADNEVFREPTEKLRRILAQVLETEDALDLECVGTELFANRLRLRMEIRSLQIYKYVVNEISIRGIGGLRFEAVPASVSMARFLGVLVRGKLPVASAPAELNRLLDEAEITEIEALEPRARVEPEAADRRQRAVTAYQQALDLIRDCMTNLKSPAELNLRRAKRTIHKLVDLSYEEGGGFSLAGLAAIKSHSEYTFNHMVNVCVLAVAFGQRLGLARIRLAQLGLCALYHDLGKLNIPLEILAKHGPLSEEEWAVMGNHVVFGAHTLFPLVVKDPATVHRIMVTLQHHVGFDGGGYPKLQVLRKPGLYSRIVTIADSYDAMTTKRVYQKRFLPDEALTVMFEHSGVRFDPLLLKAFVTCLGIFPVGSLVLMQGGELAVVCESNPDPAMVNRPIIKIITDAAHSPTPVTLVDLSQVEPEEQSIVRCVEPEEHGVNVAHYVI